MISINKIYVPERLLAWRREAIESVFGILPPDSLMRANNDYYMRHVLAGTHLALEAHVNEFPAGCGGVCFHEELPSPDNPSGKCAYLMNIYVRPEFRSQGIGRAIVEAIVYEARMRGCSKIYLETTDRGRTMYNKAGFSDMKDMLKL